MMNRMKKTERGMSLLRFAAPQVFYPLAGALAPWFAGLAAVFTIAGLWLGFFVAPTDAQQGEVYRVIFIHVPAAWMSMFVYLVMAFWAAVGLVMNTRLSFMMARALAPTGAMFCVVALVSGALWGKPTWGAYWVWDARLTSQLLLLFLYLGFMALTQAIEDPRRADRAGAIIALVGAVNVPIIYFSEHAAPGRVGEPDQCAVDGCDDARRHARDGAGDVGLHDRGGAVARAADDSRTRTPYRMGRRRAGRAGGHDLMPWESWDAFWHMGGAAPFVWGSYGLTALLVIGELIAVAHRRKDTARRLLRLRRVDAGSGGGRRVFEEMAG